MWVGICSSSFYDCQLPQGVMQHICYCPEEFKVWLLQGCISEECSPYKDRWMEFHIPLTQLEWYGYERQASHIPSVHGQIQTASTSASGFLWSLSSGLTISFNTVVLRLWILKSGFPGMGMPSGQFQMQRKCSNAKLSQSFQGIWTSV
jgi:hypothetical protein